MVQDAETAADDPLATMTGDDVAKVLLAVYADMAGLTPASPLYPDLDVVVRDAEPSTAGLLEAFNAAVARRARQAVRRRRGELRRRHTPDAERERRAR